MKGDFSRLLLDPGTPYSRVLVQQGRAQVDWDLNALGDVVLQQLRRFAVDLGGWHFAPNGDPGFTIEKSSASFDNFRIREGRYYVNGLPCDNPSAVLCEDQPFGRDPSDASLDHAGHFLVVAEAWERLVSHHEDPELREVALGGPDTAVRTGVAWRVRLLETQVAAAADVSDRADFEAELRKLLGELGAPARLSAKAAGTDPGEDPCETNPRQRFRSTENQLYRVEIHRGGRAATFDELQRMEAEGLPDAVATFVWSRENGSVVFRVEKQMGSFLVLEELGRDDRLSLRAGDWVELFDPASEAREERAHLVQVQSVEAAERRVRLAEDPEIQGFEGPLLVRRWDQRAGSRLEGGLQLSQGAGAVREDADLRLEQGVTIRFHAAPEGSPPVQYRAGDYWLVPARAILGDVLWPGAPEAPQPRQRHGPLRQYAPLLFIDKDATETVTVLRRELHAIAT